MIALSRAWDIIANESWMQDQIAGACVMMGSSQSSTCSRLCGGGYTIDTTAIEGVVAKMAAEIDSKLKENAKVTTKERRALEAKLEAKLDSVTQDVRAQLRTNGEIAVRTEASTVSAVKALLDAKMPPAPAPTFERRKRG